MKNMYKKSTTSLLLLSALLPSVTFAEGKTLKDIADLVVEYLNIGLSLIISLAVLTFVWNVYRYFFFTEADRKEAGQYVLFSVIGFFVILSFWGMVAVVRSSLKLDDRQPNTTLMGQNMGNNGNGGSSNVPPKPIPMTPGTSPTQKGTPGQISK